MLLDLAPLYYIIRHYWCPIKRDVPTIDVDARPSRNVMVIKSAVSGTEEIPVSLPMRCPRIILKNHF